MKRSIIVLIFVCIILMICACNRVTPEYPDDVDTTAAVLTEQEITTQETTARVVETEPNAGGEVPSLVIESESDYREFMAQCTQLPDGFVKYEDIAAFGEFRDLTFSVYDDYGYYLYTLTDSAGFTVLIVVNHTPAQNSDRQILTFEADATDLRLCASDSQGLVIYQTGELYYYYGSGELMWISWMQNGIEISVKGGFESKLSA